MERFFNTEGPCEPSRHYMLPPLARLPTIQRLIDRGKYLVLHAPRQSGKTTSLRALVDELNHKGRYLAAVVTMKVGAPFTDDIAQAERTLLQNWRIDLGRLPSEHQPPPWPGTEPGVGIRSALASWARTAPRPLVLFLDEIDALKGPVLLSVLRQLRAGYPHRPGDAPWSVALCGMRDIRDYRIDLDDEEQSHSQSPFNIKESLTLLPFTRDEVAALYGQHTMATGQIFTDRAIDLCFWLSGGHPWLVNAIAAELMDTVVPDRYLVIDADQVERAREGLILRRETHLDSLIERLKEPRVRRVIEPILVGSVPQMDVLNDDLSYCRDLGLVAADSPVRIANPIYQEIIPRALSYQLQQYLEQRAAPYVRDDGALDMVLLLAAFQEFFAEHSAAWLGRFDYQEAGPHLLLMAFLQRVVNGGGRIQREFAVGSGRADVIVEYGGVRSVIELKLRRGEDTLKEGLSQLSGYLDRLGEPEGFLVFFDRRKGVSWADKIFLEESAGTHGERIYVFGM